MPDVSQMLKGLLEGCILSVVAEEETYGYQIVRRLVEGGFGSVGEGSVYPILLRLERNKLVTFERRDSALGPARKYYRLTAEGRAALDTFRSEWSGLSAAVSSFMDDGEDPKEART